MRSSSIVKDIWAWYDVNPFFFLLIIIIYKYILLIGYGINLFSFRLSKPLSGLRKLPIRATSNWKMKEKDGRQLGKRLPLLKIAMLN